MWVEGKGKGKVKGEVKGVGTEAVMAEHWPPKSGSPASKRELRSAKRAVGGCEPVVGFGGSDVFGLERIGVRVNQGGRSGLESRRRVEHWIRIQ